MKITKLNYEIYAIDYLEGNLASDIKVHFDSFLEKYPEVRAELKEYLAAPVLVEDNTAAIFLGKESLRQNPSRNILWLSLVLVFFAVAATSTFYYLTQELNDNTEPSSIPQLIQSIESEAIAQVVHEKQEEQEEQEEQVKQVKQVKQDLVKKPTVQKKAIVVPAKTLQSTVQPQAVIAIAEPTTDQNSIVTKPISFLAEPTTTFVKNQKPHPELITSTNNTKLVVAAALLPTIETASVVSLTKPPLLSDKKMTFLVDLNTTRQGNKKWWGILAPRAYSGINLKEAISSNGLKSAFDEINIKNKKLKR